MSRIEVLIESYERTGYPTLNINICDDCLWENAHSHPERLLRTFSRTRQETQVLGYGLGLST